MTDLLTAALHYASALGWAVFPLQWTLDGACSCPLGRDCKAAGKHPLTAHGFADATTAPDQIAHWWQQWPRANIGVATDGDALLVVDVDPKRGGDQGMAEAEARLGALGRTLVCRTGSGGRHVYVAANGVVVSNSTDRVAPGVDVRGRGGYVVVPPSSHVSGGTYAWVDQPGTVQPCVLPPAWVEAMRPRAYAPPANVGVPGQTADSSRRQALAYLRDRAPVAVQGQGGSSTTMAVMATIRRMGVACADDAIDVIHDSGWNDRCVPPWDIEGTQGLRRKYDESSAPIGEPARERTQRAPPVGEYAERQSASDVITEARAVVPFDGATTQGLAIGERLALDNDVDADGKGRWKSTFRNTIIGIRTAKNLGKLRFNLMTLTPELDGKPVNDRTISMIREYLERTHRGLAPGKEWVVDALARVAERDSYHPVQAYLSDLQWDGVERIDRVAGEVLRAEDSPLNRAMVRCFFISAAMRAVKPGCKADTVLCLVSTQGYGKSTFFRSMGGEWFADTGLDLQNKDSYQQLHSAWIYEWAELDNMTSRAHAGRVKAVVSSARDTYRAPYARTVSAHDRSGVVVGSTNPSDWLTDPTGSRRFHPLPLTQPIDTDLADEWRDQLWAEAAECVVRHVVDPDDWRYRWWLDESTETARTDQASEWQSEDPWAGIVARWCAGRTTEITTEVVLTQAIERRREDLTRSDEMRIGAIMRSAGYRRVRRMSDAVRSYRWER